MSFTGEPIRDSRHLQNYFRMDDYYQREAGHVTALYGGGIEAFGISEKRDLAYAQFIKLVSSREDQTEGKKKQSRLGYDFVLSAPKSVSLARCLATSEALQKIYEEAHRKGVDAAMAKIEKDYFRVRVKRNGQVLSERATGMTAVSFRHLLARKVKADAIPDPLLHDHALIANYGIDADGVVRAVDYRAILDHQHELDAIYLSVMRAELERAGIRTRTTAHGFDLASVPDKQIEVFSKRRAGIVAEKDRLVEQYAGKANDRDVEQAAYRKERHTKDEVIDRETIHSSWVAQAKACGLKLTAFDQNQERAQLVEDARKHSPALVRKALEVTANDLGMFTRNDILSRAVAMAADPDGVFLYEGQPPVANLSISSIEVDNLLTQYGPEWGLLTMPVANSSPKEVELLWTTADLLAAEATNRACAAQGQGVLEPLYGSEEATRRVDEAAARVFDYSIEGEQRDTAVGILQGRDFLTLVQGDPGTGKTTMLRALVEAHGPEKFITLSKAGAAASKLGEETRTSARTIDGFLLDYRAWRKVQEDPKSASKSEVRRAKSAEKYLNSALRPGGILCIDEASMVGSLEAAQLNEIGRLHGCRMLYVGDRHQLPGVGAGLPFEEMQDLGCATYRLQEIRRQRSDAERRAVEAVTLDNDVRESVRILKEDAANGEGCVHEIPREKGQKGPDPLVQACVDDYLATVREGSPHPFLFTSTNANRDTMNHMIREGLVEDGKVDEGEPFALKSRENLAITVQMGVGDRIVFTKNAKPGDIKVLEQGGSRAERVFNSDQGFILAKEEGGYRVGMDDGRVVLWNPQAHPYADLGYALSTYKSQGQSVDQRSIYHTPADSRLLSRNEWLVGISRNKHDVGVYSDDSEKLVARASKAVEKKVTLSEWEAGRQLDGHPYASALAKAFEERRLADEALQQRKRDMLTAAGEDAKWPDVPRRERDAWNAEMNATRDTFQAAVLAAREQTQHDQLSKRLDLAIEAWEHQRRQAEKHGGQMGPINKAKAEITADYGLIKGVEAQTRRQEQGQAEHEAQQRIEEARQAQLFAGDQAYTERQERERQAQAEQGRLLTPEERREALGAANRRIAEETDTTKARIQERDAEAQEEPREEREPEHRPEPKEQEQEEKAKAAEAKREPAPATESNAERMREAEEEKRRRREEEQGHGLRR